MPTNLYNVSEFASQMRLHPACRFYFPWAVLIGLPLCCVCSLALCQEAGFLPPSSETGAQDNEGPPRQSQNQSSYEIYVGGLNHSDITVALESMDVTVLRMNSDGTSIFVSSLNSSTAETVVESLRVQARAKSPDQAVEVEEGTGMGDID